MQQQTGTGVGQANSGQSAQMQAGQSGTSPGGGQMQPPKKKNWLMWLLIVLGIVIVLGLIVWLF